MATPNAGTTLDWGLFAALVLGLLALDIGLLGQFERRGSLRRAALWSVVWTAAALGFNAWIYRRLGRQLGLEFLSAYIVERSLSFDNLFVFALIFEYFGVPREQQRRVLTWGVLGALASRGLFIAIGAALLARSVLLLPLLGAFLAWTGTRFLRQGTVRFDSDRNPILRLARRALPITDADFGEGHGSFLVRREGRTLATPLLLALIAVEAADLAFAADSIPAAFGVSRHLFIVWSSNVFAILGLRALYPVIAELMRRLHGLGRGLGLLLVLVGLEMLAAPWVAIPAEFTFVLVVVGLALALGVSLLGQRRNGVVG